MWAGCWLSQLFFFELRCDINSPPIKNKKILNYRPVVSSVKRESISKRRLVPISGYFHNFLRTTQSQSRFVLRSSLVVRLVLLRRMMTTIGWDDAKVTTMC